MTLFTANEILREQFENLVNLAVVTNVVPYILVTLSVPVMMERSNVSKSHINRFRVIGILGVLYCVYAIYSCGESAIVGGACALLIGLGICAVRKIIAVRRAQRELQQSID